MPRRFPFLLWRSLTADLFRLICLSAGVLVTVIAFAAAVKPISDGLLQSGDLLKFIAFAIPPMLAYALPFAAGFGATLVYHRVAHDNEAVAAHAGGISHRALLAAALTTGMILAGVMVILNEAVIPRFLNRMQRLITRDLATWVVQEIGKGKAVDAGGMTLFADSASKLEPEPGSGATDMLLLRKFAAIERDKTGTPITEVTSAMGWIWLFPWEGNNPTEPTGAQQPQSRVVMRLENVIGLQQSKGLGAFKDKVDLSWTVPNPFRDNPKFLTWSELRDLPLHPERMSWVDIRRKDLAYCLAERRAITELEAAAQNSGIIHLLDDSGRTVSITTSGLERKGAAWRLKPGPGGVVSIRLARGGDSASMGNATMLRTPNATLLPSIGPDRFNRGFDFAIDAEQVSVTENTAAGQTTTQRPAYRVTALKPVENPVTPLLSLTSPQLLELAGKDPMFAGPDPKTAFATTDLSNYVLRVSRQVLSKQHERAAMAASCLIMVLTGAVTSLRLSKRQPLTVYMFTFLPAAICLITVSGGQQATVQSGQYGLLLTWGGVAALALYTFHNYLILIRH